MTLVDKIFAHARATPDRPALTYLDATYSYLALASRTLQARAWFERHPVAADQVAVIYTTDMARGWIVGLALRSLGVNTVAGRLPGDLEQLGLGVLSVVVIEPEPWPGLGEAAARAGCPLITVPNDVWDDNGAVPPEEYGQDRARRAEGPAGHCRNDGLTTRRSRCRDTKVSPKLPKPRLFRAARRVRVARAQPIKTSCG